MPAILTPFDLGSLAHRRLTPRQRILYTDRACLYEPVWTRDPTTGRPTKRVFHLRATNVPCYFEISAQSVEVPSFLGAIESDNSFSRDQVHMPASIQADSGWIIKNVTRETGSGAPSQNFGRYWVISGQPKSISQRGRRRAQKRQFEAIQFQRPPEGVDPNGTDE
jgi:hypothetical protein